jgi:hypothetical protein
MLTLGGKSTARDCAIKHHSIVKRVVIIFIELIKWTEDYTLLIDA